MRLLIRITSLIKAQIRVLVIIVAIVVIRLILL